MSLSFNIPEWVANALCAQVDPELFFADEKGVQPTAAREVCSRFPVRAACLAYALDLARDGTALNGVWGGTTEVERRRLRGFRTCRDCDAVIPNGKGAALRCDLHREQRRRDTRSAYTARQAGAA